MENGEQHSGRFAIIPSVALEDPRITPALLKLLCVLGTYGNKHGYCWPSRDTLAKRLGGISKPAISQGMRKLQDYGYLEVTPRFDRAGGRTVNLYRILFDQPDPEVTGGLAPEVTGGLAPEVTGGLAPEVTPLNVPYERPKLTLSAAAAISLPTGEGVNGVTDDAAAAWNDNVLRQTAEQIRQRLSMPLRNLAGIQDILRQYPEASQYFIVQAAACAEKLRTRPLKLVHFAEWLRRARERAEEERENHDTTNEYRPSDEDKRLAAQADEERRRKLDDGVQAILEKYSRQATG